jgi:antitoxin ParD1/3/4
VNLSVSLTPDLVGLIEAKVASGRFASTSEVVSEALRLLDRAEERTAETRARLRQAWEERLASGDAGPLGFADLRAQARRGLAEPTTG